MTSSTLPLAARLLGAFLALWEPLTFAFTLSAALPRLAVYGWPAYLLAAYRMAVVGLGVAAGRSLWAAAPGARRLVQGWALAHAVGLVLTFSTPFFPSNRVPGTKGPLLAVLVVFDLACWAWATRSRRLAAALGE